MVTKEQVKNAENFIIDEKIRQRIDATFTDIPEEEATLHAPAGTFHVKAFDVNLKQGEIRMLSQLDQLTYVVLLNWDEDQHLIIPFSDRDFPATDDEMFAEHHEENADYLKVLQIWNARTVPDKVLEKTWTVGNVSEQEIASIKKMLAHVWLGDTLPADIQNRTATPIRHPKDIRNTYIHQVLDLFNKLESTQIQ